MKANNNFMTFIFEMAQQLVAQGQKVALLALFDTILPDAYTPLPIRQRLSVHLSKVLQLGPAYVLKQLNERVQKLQDKSLRIYSKFYLGRKRLVPHTLEYFALLEVKNQAVRQYVPQVYPGRVTLFKATERVDEATSNVDPNLGWGKLAAGGLEIYEVPGDHLSMLKEPHVQVLGEKLKTCLAQA